MPRKPTQNGNVLFLILIAVVLFSALGYAIFGRGGGSQGAMSRERAGVQASQIIGFLNSLRNGTENMVTNNRCRESDLDFGTDVWKTNDGSDTTAANGSAPVNGTCSLFNAHGGGQAPKIFTQAISRDYPTTSGKIAAGHARIGVGLMERQGSGLNDVLIVIAGLDAEVCRAIAKQQGIAAASTTNELAVDCFSLSPTSPTSYAYSVPSNQQLGETATQTRAPISVGVCNTSNSDNPLAVSDKSCYAVGVLLAR